MILFNIASADISRYQLRVSWFYIGKDHKIKWNKDCATMFKKQMDYSSVFIILQLNSFSWKLTSRRFLILTQFQILSVELFMNLDMVLCHRWLYTYSPTYAHFGFWKKTVYAKFKKWDCTNECGIPPTNAYISNNMCKWKLPSWKPC